MGWKFVLSHYSGYRLLQQTACSFVEAVNQCVRTASCEVSHGDVSPREARVPLEVTPTVVRSTVRAARRPQHGRTRRTAALPPSGPLIDAVAVLAVRQQTLHTSSARTRVACTRASIKLET